MEALNKSGIVPDQQTGKAIDAESSIELTNENEARAFFTEVKSRLQNVNQWHEYAGVLLASFQLVDKNGIEVQREARKGDYFKIDIPGPGSKSGDGFDWVQIEDENYTSTPDGEQFGFRVRPTDNPQSREQDVAHFYSKESTSTFIAQRIGNKITVSIHDRNTKPNTDADRTPDKVRDALVGTAGAISFSKIQWQNLTDGILKK
jgi:hypothetical protein